MAARAAAPLRRPTMPIYAYRCEQCGHQLELLQKVGAAPPAACPACGAARMRKQVTAAGFRLKGGGWYETDFKRGDKRNVAGDREAAAKPKEGDKKKSGAGKGAAAKPAAAAAAD